MYFLRDPFQRKIRKPQLEKALSNKLPKTDEIHIIFKTKWYLINHFKPEFTIVIFIHYKPQLVVNEHDLKGALNEKKIL